jgi:hypothetical protein
MTVIACLGWGSLVWDPKKLPLKTEWRSDGPMIPVEFLRRSDKGKRITLVLDESAEPVQGLWALLNAETIDIAAEALREREEIPPRNISIHIGRWNGGDDPMLIPGLRDWAASRNIDAVIWTALPRKFYDLQRAASVDEIVTYLGSLTGQIRADSEEYVRRAPLQIDTAYRRRIAEALAWTPTSK